MSDEQNQSPKQEPRIRVSEMMDQMADRAASGLQALACRIKASSDLLHTHAHAKTTVAVCKRIGISPDWTVSDGASRFGTGVEMLRQQIKELEEQLRKLEEK